MRFTTVRLTTIRNGPKETISASGGFGLLKMELELDTGRCVSEDAGPPRKRVDCEIPYRLERGTEHSL